MAAEPILVLQMQRMGDLVLSFPLLSRLGTIFPGHPVWVVAERMFYEGLMPLSPPTAYLSTTELARLPKGPYRAVINLSHREEALEAAGRCETPLRIGPYRDAGGTRRIGGRWQLYRESVIHSNRHNRFHWADLHQLDLPGFPGDMRNLMPDLRPFSGKGRIGLFLGASDEQKRPDAVFWAELNRSLLAHGCLPVLLGGRAEQALADEVTASLGSDQVLNLCGRFCVSDLSQMLSRLDLLVTPDTGPMHVAAWTGTRCLNLSMGPVNAWETGPHGPGHFILRPRVSCTGCWTCHRGDAPCRQAFHAGRVASLIRRILAGSAPDLAEHELANLELLRTERDRFGLYDLVPLAKTPPIGRGRLSAFWKAFFGYRLGLMPEEEPQKAALLLQASLPKLTGCMAAALPTLGRDIAPLLRKGRSALVDTYWQQGPPHLRPFRSFALAELDNADYERGAIARVLESLEDLARFIR